MIPYTQKYLLDHPISFTPMGEIAGFSVRPGLFDVNGAMALPNGVNFTIHTHNGTSCELLLFERDQEEPFAVLPFPKSYKIGDVYSMIVFDLDIETFEYAYRIDGPYSPEEGMIFDRRNVLLDPYAVAVTGQDSWGSKKKKNYHAKVIRDIFDWGDMPQSSKEMCDLIIYELHVRGFTRHHTSGVANPGTFDGLKEKIPYLKELGINAVELMPVFEFDEMKDCREVDGRQVLDYWGYNTVSFFAPNTSYAGHSEYNREGNELKDLIKTLHENNIECFLDVVFNHTAEGDERGPSFSFKGFDNNIYYMLTPDGYYYNFSGCGNTLNCNHPIVRQMILECLRYWTTAYHVDGFRFDLASILGRSPDGTPMSNPPLLQSLAFDPLLGNAKLIAEAWDAGGLYQVGSFPAWSRWAEWNGKYRDDMRDYLKGDYGMSEVAAQRIMGSRDLYDPKVRGNNASINFLNCHDGFPLWDMYSYSRKHNEANGWYNVDGSDDNRSWNCGAEGETDDENILALRRKLAKNAVTVLMMSRGTPMFLAGDEFLNTQFGNNNAYCQDNEVSWLDWDFLKKNKDHFDYTKHVIGLRKKHSVVRKFSGHCTIGLPEVMNIMPDERTKTVAIIYAGRGEGDKADDVICLIINTFWEEQTCFLPQQLHSAQLKVEADTSGKYLPGNIADAAHPVVLSGGQVVMEPRSVVVLSLV